MTLGAVPRGMWIGAALLAGSAVASAQTAPVQTPAPAPAADAAAPAAQTPAATPAPAAPAQGGQIHGTVVAGTAGATGKAAGVPLPGVAVTATNSLTGKKYATTTDVTGAYAMSIPRNGRYVVRVELAAFASTTSEVLVNAAGENGGKPDQTADFGIQLQSRVAAAEAQQTAQASALGRGLQSLNLSGAGGGDVTDASAGGGNSGAALPTMAGLGDSAGASADAVAVSGRSGETNGMANFSEDEIRSRIEDAVAQGRANGMIPQGVDPTNMIVSVLGGMMGGPGGGGPGGGGRRGGGGGPGGGGSGAFRNFNPATPHGNIFYQGGNNALNSAAWSPTLVAQPQVSGYQNRFGASIAGSPYIPGLFQPNTKQFGFLNISGQKNLNPFAPNPVRVPTDLERTGDFSQSQQLINGTPTNVNIYDPNSGAQFTGPNAAGNSVPNVIPSARINQQAQNILNAYYPHCNTNCLAAQGDPTLYNYQTVANSASNNIVVNARYNYNFGQATTRNPFGGGGGGGRGGGGGGGRNNNAPPTLRQSINAGLNYSHNAQDIRNIFLPLGGGSQTDGYAVNAGYTVGYGRLSNNASLSWNRNHTLQHNYFTNTALNPSNVVQLNNIPNGASTLPNPAFYNGLPTFTINNFASITNTVPIETIGQTISFSDFVSYRHKKHNYRFGFDLRRVHQDSEGGSNPLGAYTFTGYNTESRADQASTASSTGQAASGSSFADFLLGLPQQSTLQAGATKIYLRENVYDGYAQDDFRVMANVTLNFGLRYEYFGPFTEKNNRLVNLDHNANFTAVAQVLPGQVGPFSGITYPSSLINPDKDLFSPRVGVAWHPKYPFTKDTVIRAGYGINFNTTQYQSFAKSLAFQPPFSNTQNNVLNVPRSQYHGLLYRGPVAERIAKWLRLLERDHHQEQLFGQSKLSAWQRAGI